jgi:O-acetyl-ADP-ribose deacetylase (regulator of RNase III)
MMEIIKGNLVTLALSGEAKVIVHGCNCFHAMGSGIAGVLADRFPEIPAADRKTPKGFIGKLGDFSVANVSEHHLSSGLHTRKLDEPFQCVNLYTQYLPGADFLPSLFPVGLRRLNTRFAGQTLWFPMIGCGIGGGDWASVMGDMLKYLPDVDVKVVVL